MSRISEAVAALNELMEAPARYINGTKIYEPREGDAFSAIKTELQNHAVRARDLATQFPDGVPTALLSNDLFLDLERLPDEDPEKQDYFTLLSRVQRLLNALNRPE